MTNIEDRAPQDRPTVWIVDDHTLLSSALVLALGSRGVRAWALAPGELLAQLEHPAPPGGLLLLDLDLGADIDGAHLVRPLRRAGWRVLVITGTTDEAHIAAAVAAGAAGWVSKTVPFDELVTNTVHAAQGRSLLTEAEYQRLRGIATANRQADESFTQRWNQLTPREREIVNYLVEGLRAQVIAQRSCVSLATVRTQIRSILAKLGVSSQLEAVALVRQHGS